MKPKDEDLDFDTKKHVKVRLKKTGSLHVVFFSEHPDFYQLSDEDEVVIHIINKYNFIIHNDHENMRKQYRHKKGELKVEGDKVVS